MKTMKAAVWSGPRDLALREVPVPQPGEGEVLVRTRVVGICGTDFEIYDGRFKQAVPPMILGHEGAGTVEALGPGVDALEPGVRVSVECVIGCGRCEYCMDGRPGLCEQGRVMGVSGAQGEYAEYFVAPAANCHPLPEEISWAEAGLVDTLAGPVYAMSRVAVPAGGTVAVFGPGPAGLFFCSLAKLHGAATVLLVGTRQGRLDYGPRFGADRLILAGREDPVSAVLEATDGRGAELVVEASGSGVALGQCLAAARKGGSVIIYGVFGTAVSLEVQPIQLHELQVFGTANILYPPAIRLIREAKVRIQPLITHRLRLEELPDAFAGGSIQERRGAYEGYMKGVVLL
ncbi:MAG: alcohol dehydrogenase catalytic domain-containing protein [Spirochaetales bacterium]|nr:alcohol dehydrogenase catalytic domain-containing protein [Spirochaetales bacterium]